MKRRTLLKLLSLLPFAGPVFTKALAKSISKQRPVYGPYLPAGFPKWDRAIDGLEDAGKWTLEIQRSLLPQNLTIPRAGQIWQAVRDCETRLRPLFSPPWPQTASPLRLCELLGAKAQIRQGKRILILEMGESKPLFVKFQPLHYDESQTDIVPEDIRKMPGYLGYELSVKIAKTVVDFGTDACQTYFNEAFRFVRDAA